MKINLHTHSTFCDGHDTLEQLVLTAIEKKFDVLGFSGHCMHPINPEFYVPDDSLWHIPSGKISAYIKEILRLKEKYSGQIKLLAGFEADYFESPQYGSAIPDKGIYSEFSPDFLIGAVHFVNAPNGFYTVDNRTEAVREGLVRLYSGADGVIDGKRAVCDYFEAQRQMLKNGSFDIWAHPDLVRKRNGSLHFFDEREGWYREQLRLTARAAAAAGVIAEINTGAMARGAMNDFYPSAEFLELIHDNGIPIIISSDCHRREQLDFAFDKALAAARRAGYDELMYPENGRFVSVKIRQD